MEDNTTLYIQIALMTSIIGGFVYALLGNKHKQK
jgi:MFS superfamily sulfate permease-like transporter